MAIARVDGVLSVRFDLRALDALGAGTVPARWTPYLNIVKSFADDFSRCDQAWGVSASLGPGATVTYNLNGGALENEFGEVVALSRFYALWIRNKGTGALVFGNDADNLSNLFLDTSDALKISAGMLAAFVTGSDGLVYGSDQLVKLENLELFAQTYEIFVAGKAA